MVTPGRSGRVLAWQRTRPAWEDRQPPRALQPGQTLESWVEGVGTIRNRCV